MKRDMDLIRALLMEIEKLDRPAMHDLMGSAFPEDKKRLVGHNLLILIQADYLSGVDAHSMTDDDFLNLDLTWKGHELLDSIRDSAVWSETKKQMKQVGNASVQLVIDLATAYAKKLAKEKLGIEI
ncbi:MAG: DUF2513 domain-containing protein [Reyranellaceae bacterium]